MCSEPILICFAAEDLNYANWIGDYIDLSIGKRNVWTYQKIRSGEWRPQLFQKLDACKIVVFLLSKSFVGSYAETVENPIAQFLQGTRNSDIIPVLIDDDEQARVPFKNCQFANLSAGDRPLSSYLSDMREFRIQLHKIGSFIGEAYARIVGLHATDLQQDLHDRISSLLGGNSEKATEIANCIVQQSQVCTNRAAALALIADLLDNKQALGETFKIALSLEKCIDIL